MSHSFRVKPKIILKYFILIAFEAVLHLIRQFQYQKFIFFINFFRMNKNSGKNKIGCFSCDKRVMNKSQDKMVIVQTSRKSKEKLQKVISKKSNRSISKITKNESTVSKVEHTIRKKGNNLKNISQCQLSLHNRSTDKQFYSTKPLKQLKKKVEATKTSRKQEYLQKLTKKTTEQLLKIDLDKTDKGYSSEQKASSKNTRQNIKESEEQARYLQNIELILNQSTQKMLDVKRFSDKKVIEQMEFNQSLLQKKVIELEQSHSHIEKESRMRYLSLQESSNSAQQKLQLKIHDLEKKADEEQAHQKKLETKLFQCESNLVHLHQKLSIKETEVQELRKNNTTLREENHQISEKVQQFEVQINSLEDNIINLNSMKQLLQRKLKRYQDEKEQIKKNSEEILKTLREEYSDIFDRDDDESEDLEYVK